MYLNDIDKFFHKTFILYRHSTKDILTIIISDSENIRHKN